MRQGTINLPRQQKSQTLHRTKTQARRPWQPQLPRWPDWSLSVPGRRHGTAPRLVDGVEFWVWGLGCDMALVPVAMLALQSLWIHRQLGRIPAQMLMSTGLQREGKMAQGLGVPMELSHGDVLRGVCLTAGIAQLGDDCGCPSFSGPVVG